MSLRWRLTAMIGGVVALMVAGASLLAYVSAERELDRQVNEFLITRSRETEEGLATLLNSPRLTAENAAFRAGALTRADANIQLLYPDGERALLLSGSALPVTTDDAVIAADQTEDLVVRNSSDRVVDGQRYRVLTSSVPSGALMVARSIDDVDRTLSGLRRWLIA
ncbi:MAG: hypothetical protein ACR2P0_15260, partial [Acidimicrobiales bacterium]